MATQQHVLLELVPDPRSVGEARAFVRRAARERGLEDRDGIAALLTSELATNAVVHARTRFAVAVSGRAEQLVVDVLDDSPGPPQPREHDLSASHGRGLSLVAALASEWGPTPPSELGSFAKGIRFAVPG